jgi:tetratricopeptide (TPR) repeat protein
MSFMIPNKHIDGGRTSLAGWETLARGDVPAAMAIFHDVLARRPHDPEALTGMGSALRQQGQLREAILHCDAAIRSDAGYAPAWLERAFVFAAGGSIDPAFDCYAQAAARDPDCAGAFAGMASISARRGDAAATRNHALRALAIDPRNVIATCALATIEIEGGDAAVAEQRLAALLEHDGGPTAENAVAYNVLGDARDRLGKIDGAFCAYATGKKIFVQVHAPLMDTRTQTQTQFIEMIRDGLAAVDGTSGWAIADDSASPRHVFLLGYPRSGTTLVENILASMPKTTALEERPTLGESDRAFLVDPEAITQLAALDWGGAKQHRNAYWAKVAASGATPPPDGMFVDMDPLKATRLPIIARLFPTAHILIMRRDPRDVVWSCFHTNFALTNATYEYTDLERTARHYDAMMRLTELCLAKLPLNTHIVRYDRIVRDFEAETKRLCAFIGTPWSEDLRHFDRTALKRGVATASAAQVRKPLYDGTRQWERYALHLAPVMPILQPWIDKFGFDG